jgi:hypothetical protein
LNSKNFLQSYKLVSLPYNTPEISSLSLEKYKPKVYMMQLKMQSRTQGIGGINNDVGHGTKM